MAIKDMVTHLPPLAALQAFEAAARHLSFKKAADELCVTPSSVSHQIKRLEDRLGLKLFLRFNREVALTRDGTHYAGAIAAALSDISHATDSISRRSKKLHTKQRLVLSANSGFIDCWLSRRLADFSKAEPQIELELHYGEDFADYRHRDADVAVHFSGSGSPGGDALALFRGVEFPVCSPSLQVNGRKLVDPKDLGSLTLLHEHDRIGWRRWLQAANVEGVDDTLGPVFQNTQTVFSGVKAGEGVGLADEFVAYDELVAGHLVKPFSFVRESDWTVYLVQLNRNREPAAVDAFSEWLVKTINTFLEQTVEIRGMCPFPSTWPN